MKTLYLPESLPDSMFTQFFFRIIQMNGIYRWELSFHSIGIVECPISLNRTFILFFAKCAHTNCLIVINQTIPIQCMTAMISINNILDFQISTF